MSPSATQIPSSERGNMRGGSAEGGGEAEESLVHADVEHAAHSLHVVQATGFDGCGILICWAFH